MRWPNPMFAGFGVTLLEILAGAALGLLWTAFVLFLISFL